MSSSPYPYPRSRSLDSTFTFPRLRPETILANLFDGVQACSEITSIDDERSLGALLVLRVISMRRDELFDRIAGMSCSCSAS